MKIYKKLWSIILSILFISSILFGCSTSISRNTKTSSSNVSNSSGIKVHYIDVGQGDSILVQVNNKNLLIDAGPKAELTKFSKYLSSLNLKKIDYFITTHPHEDHIGGATYVLNKYEIGKFFAPRKTATTRTYKNMISELKKNNLKINVAKAGVSIDLGNNVQCELLSPSKSRYESTNDYSPIIKLQYKNNKFLFTGDAETLVEKETINNKYDLSADVLKIGHHGSVSSTSKTFLNAVSPKIAIISCGTNNRYGHPHRETLQKLNSKHVKTYRTDLKGTIIVNGDGSNLKVSTKK